MVPQDDLKIITHTEPVAPLLAVQDEPEKALMIAQKYTKVLVDIIEAQKLYSLIQNRKYIRVEGWTALAGLVGVFPYTIYSKRLDRGRYEIAYEAKVELRNRSGQAISSAEAICSNQEKGKDDQPEYAIKSMAITRATGKACRLAFSWIIALAGYETTPAEEMDGISPSSPPSTPPPNRKPKQKSQKSKEDKKPLTIPQATLIIQNIIGSHLMSQFEKWRLAKKLFDGQNILSKSHAEKIINWWIGRKTKTGKILEKSEREKRLELEKQDEKALDNYLSETYETYCKKNPNEIKNYSYFCSLPAEKLPFNIFDTTELMKTYLEFRKILGLDKEGGE